MEGLILVRVMLGLLIAFATCLGSMALVKTDRPGKVRPLDVAEATSIRGGASSANCVVPGTPTKCPASYNCMNTACRNQLINNKPTLYCPISRFANVEQLGPIPTCTTAATGGQSCPGNFVPCTLLMQCLTTCTPQMVNGLPVNMCAGPVGPGAPSNPTLQQAPDGNKCPPPYSG